MRVLRRHEFGAMCVLILVDYACGVKGFLSRRGLYKFVQRVAKL